MGSYAEHQEILGRAFLHFQEHFPQGRIFTRHTGKFINMRFIDELNACRHDLHRILHAIKNFKRFLISISIPGQADSYITLPVRGELVHIEVEVKSGDAVQSKEQKAWEAAITEQGGLYILVRNPEDIVNAIKTKWPEFS